MPSPTKRFVKRARSLGATVYTRRQWGSLALPTYGIRRKTRPHKMQSGYVVDTIWQHITVTKDTGNSRVSFKQDMRTLEGIGMQRFLSGVSYNLVIDMGTGEVGIGASLDAKGTHTLNDKKIDGYSFDQNYVSFAFAFIGMPGDKPSRKAIVAAARCMAALMDLGYVTADLDYNPHRLVAYKDCPTDAVVNAMPEIYALAKQIHKR